MNYDFGENEQAGQEKIQRMMAEADEWRRARTDFDSSSAACIGEVASSLP